MTQGVTQTEYEQVAEFRKLIERMSQGGGDMDAKDYTRFLIYCRHAASVWAGTLAAIAPTPNAHPIKPRCPGCGGRNIARNPDMPELDCCLDCKAAWEAK